MLVVDDDRELCERVCLGLEEHGFAASYARSGVRALELLRTRGARPDIILLDLNMPDMNGWQFRARQLEHAELSAIPVVVMTGSRDVPDVPAAGIVFKPLDFPVLAARLTQQLEWSAPPSPALPRLGVGRLLQRDHGWALRVAPRAGRREAPTHALLESLDAGVGALDRDHRFTWFNSKLLQLTARSANELELLPAEALVHPSHAVAFADRLDRFFATGRKPYEDELRLLRPGRAPLWVRCSVTSHDDGAAVLITDVSAARTADAALRESPALLQWQTHADGRLRFVSHGWLAFTGLSLDVALSTGRLAAVHPDDAERVRAQLDAARSFRIEYRLRRADGAWRWMLETASPSPGPRGELLGFAGTLVDITERRASERALEASEARYRSLFDNAHVSLFEQDLSQARALLDAHAHEAGGDLRGFLAANPDLVEELVERIRFRDVNAGTLALFGAANKQHLAAALHTVFPPQMRRVFVDELLALMEGKSTFAAEASVRTVSGEPRDVLASFGFPDPSGPCDRVLMTLTEVTAQKALEREREERLAEAYGRLELSETFVGVLGHDLRTPLAAIATTTDALLRKAQDERLTRPLGRIRQSVDRMGRMVEQVLDFTRARLGGGIPIKPCSMDLRVLVLLLVDEMSITTSQPIELDIQGDTVGDWDGDRIVQVLQNLLANALEHGTGFAPVRVRLDGTDAGAVKLEVWNPGAMSEQMQAQVFAPFKRPGMRKSDTSRGLGLGLFIVQQVVKGHGGVIALRSTPEEGTTFTVTLPRCPPVTSGTRETVTAR